MPNAKAELHYDAAVLAAQTALDLSITMRRGIEAREPPFIVRQRHTTEISMLSSTEQRWMRCSTISRNHMVSTPRSQAEPVVTARPTETKPTNMHQEFLDKHGVGKIAVDSRLGARAWRRAVCQSAPLKGWPGASAAANQSRPVTARIVALSDAHRQVASPRLPSAGSSRELSAWRPTSGGSTRRLAHEETGVHWVDAVVEQEAPVLVVPWYAP